MAPRTDSTVAPTPGMAYGGRRGRVQRDPQLGAGAGCRLPVQRQYAPARQRPPAALRCRADSGSSYSLGFAPGIEYNWSARAGVLLGVRIISIGRNTAPTVTPALAVNLVF